MRYFLIITVLFLFLPASALAWPGRIVNVLDGDTIDVEPAVGGQRVRVRLHGIDAPEKRQSGGEAARDFAFGFLYQEVEVKEEGKNPDRYGRVVAAIYLSDTETLQAALLHAGLAWVWPRYCKNCYSWQALQDDARRAKRGLWYEQSPIPPWEWRQLRRDTNQRQ
jgi:Micrococcal nuclease (thermonuclease) homologs